MNIQDTEALLKLLRAYGVSHYKSGKVEVHLKPGIAHIPIYRQDKESDPKAKMADPPHAAAVPPVDMDIVHHVNEVASLLKLNDEQLVDKMFPDYSDMPKEGV